MNISVVIPCYNVEEFIPRLFDSISIQNNESIEYIFVDDGSLDKTGFLIDDFCSKEKSARAIHQANKGVCCARNVGLASSVGEYVFFLDGDDVLTDNASDVFSKVISGGDDIVCFKNKHKKNGRLSVCNSTVPAGSYSLSDFLKFNEIADSGGGVRLYRRHFLVDNRIFFDEDLVVGEVMAFFIHSLVKCKKIAFCDDAVMVYMIRQTSVSKSVNYEKDYRIFDTFDRIQSYCDQYDLTLKYSNIIRRVVVRFLLGFTLNKYAKDNIGWNSYIARVFHKIKHNCFYRSCLFRVLMDKKTRLITKYVAIVILLLPSRMAYFLMTKKNIRNRGVEC